MSCGERDGTMERKSEVKLGTVALSPRCSAFARISIRSLLGRPSKRTPERVERILRSLRAGNSFRTALRAAGVGESTGYAWMQQGKEDEDGPCGEFYVRVQQTIAEVEEHTVDQLE